MKRTRKKRVWWPVVLLIALLLMAGLVMAAGEMMPRSLVSSGGGIVGDAGYGLHSAVGQPVAGAVQNDLTLCSGYLCAADAPLSPAPGDDHLLYLPMTVR